MNRLRLTIVETHPIQYNAPWFRQIAAECDEIDLTVVYASRPTPAQQAVGYRSAFEWNSDLFEGYTSHVVRESRPDETFDSERFDGLDVKEIGRAVLETRPDAALIRGVALRLAAARDAHLSRARHSGDLSRRHPPGHGTERSARAAVAREDAGDAGGLLGVSRGGHAGARVHDRHTAYRRHPFFRRRMRSTTDSLPRARRRISPPRAGPRSGPGFGCNPNDFVVLFAGRVNAGKRPARSDRRRRTPRASRRTRRCRRRRWPRRHAVGGRAARRARRAWPGFVNQRELGEHLRRGRLPRAAERPRVVGPRRERGARHRPAGRDQRSWPGARRI